LETTLDAITDQRIMILSTTRPTFDYSFGGHPIVTRFALNRLGKDQIGTIVSKLTGGKALPDEIMDIITHRTDGVPLFVEELTKTILESGALKESDGQLVLDGPLNAIAIPTTLHDSLMARLDRLQPIKEVAQTAACIGRTFDHGLLVQVSPLPEAELNSALDGLIEAELIYRRGLPPEATYQFKHALVRDAAYESLLKDKRRAVHTRILAALESQPDVAPEVLAVHAEAAILTERAIALWEAASKTAIARPAFDEGIAHLHRAIALITPSIEGRDPATTEHALALQVQLSMALLVRVGYGADETIAAFEHALTLADNIGETPMRYSVLYGLWIGKGIRGEYTEALKRANALVEQAAKSSETASFVVANRVAGATNFFIGNLAEADKHLAIAIEHYDSVEHAGLANRFGQDIGVSINVFAAHQKLLMGQTQKARAHSDESERIAKSTKHVQTIGYMLMIRALFAIDACDYALVERCVSELEPIAYEHKLTVWLDFAGLVREILQARNGDAGSFERYLQADAAIIATETRMFVPQIRTAMGWTALSMGRHYEAANLASMAQALIDQTGEAYSLSDLHRLKGALALDQGDALAAETSLNMAVEVAREQGAKLWELRAAIDLARLWREQGRADEAIVLLEPVYESIEDGDCAEDQATSRALLVALKD
jgi:tetratricopeptide (TPR) repeat protein